jgi:membrane protease YdiL (CAAX protease family)
MDLDPPPTSWSAPPDAVRPAVAPIDRVAAAFEILLCSGFPTQLILIAVLQVAGLRPQTAGGQLNPPFIFALTLLDTVLVVGLVALFFRIRRESMRAELFGARTGLREVLLGLALVPASFALVVYVLALLQVAAPSLHNVSHNPLADLAKTRTQAVIFAFVVMVAGGVREEIQRGFVLRRFEQYLGGGVAGIVIFSVLFGLGHLEQGRDVAIGTATLGAFWGAVFLVRRSVLAPMIGHAGFNLSQIAKFIFLGAA